MSPATHSDQRVPFSPVDEAILLLDNEAEPWSIQLEVRVSSSLDEQRLRAAVSDAVRHHPMARARKVMSQLSGRRFAWEITDQPDLDPVSVVDCADDEELAATRAELQSRPVPVVESPPFRVRLAHHPEGDVVMLNVNHAAIDGFGTRRLLNSIARAYRRVPDPLPDIDALEARELRDNLAAEDSSAKARRVAALAEKMRDVVVPTARLALDGALDEPGYGFHHVSLDEERSKALTDLDLPGTVNDVLLAALHLTVAGWNEEHQSKSRRIGVMVPVNLRPREWWEEVAGNFSLMVRVSTDAKDRSDIPTVLEAMSDQSGRIKQGGTGAALMEVIGGLPSLPVWLKGALSYLASVAGRRLADTAMLSNLGLLKEAPSFGPEAGDPTEMWFSAPARMPMGVSIGVLTAGGRLYFSFRYRRAQFGPEACRRFADRYFEVLNSFLEAAES